MFRNYDRNHDQEPKTVLKIDNKKVFFHSIYTFLLKYYLQEQVFRISIQEYTQFIIHNNRDKDLIIIYILSIYDNIIAVQTLTLKLS
ncbi:hypothetical protein pb186bvf_001745 [Paramecium bursaria]